MHTYIFLYVDLYMYVYTTIQTHPYVCMPVYTHHVYIDIYQFSLPIFMHICGCVYTNMILYVCTYVSVYKVYIDASYM